MAERGYDGLVSRYLNRRLSRPVARALARTPVTPNQVSVAAFLAAAAAGAAFAAGLAPLGGAVAQASSVVDGVDGDLARAKGMSSRWGGAFDSVLDRYADVAILGGMTVWAVRHEDWPGAAAVGFLAVLGSLLISYSRARVEASTDAPLSDGLLGLASRDVRLFLVFLGGLAGQAYWTLALLAALTFATVLWRLAYLRFVLRPR
ncbi:MAG TPA: CDP-alcohol phosphatidyltransferase family protein [Dehalococcoidia bacterium]